MRKLIILALFTLFVSSPSFAADDQAMGMAPDEATSSDCEAIAKACRDAGYARKGEKGKFWRDCMKPILFNKQVNGINIDAKVVSNCRQFKIKNMQEQIDQFKKLQ